MSILLVSFLSSTTAFGQPQDANQVQIVEQTKELTADANKVTDANAAVDANTAADTNAITDPNAVRAKIEKFEGLSGVLSQINMESSDEISRWTLGREEKLDLALAVQKQITEELKLLRELAVKEGAVKTSAAIDGILLDRQERFKVVIETLEKETERYRRFAEREEKRREMRERNRERTPDRNKRDVQQ
jgi:Fic family protein